MITALQPKGCITARNTPPNASAGYRIRSRASKYRLCWVEAGVWSSGFQEAQHGHGSPDKEQPAAIGGDMLVTAGAEAEEVAELIVAAAEPSS